MQVNDFTAGLFCSGNFGIGTTFFTEFYMAEHTIKLTNSLSAIITHMLNNMHPCSIFYLGVCIISCDHCYKVHVGQTSPCWQGDKEQNLQLVTQYAVVIMQLSSWLFTEKWLIIEYLHGFSQLQCSVSSTFHNLFLLSTP